MSLQDIVQITITKVSTAVTRTGFGTMMALADHNRTLERIVYYSELSEMVTAGFLTTDATYLAASAYFGQSPKPDQIGVGQIYATEQDVTVLGTSGSFDFSIRALQSDGSYITENFTVPWNTSATQTATDMVTAITGGTTNVGASSAAAVVTVVIGTAISFSITVVSVTQLTLAAATTVEDHDTALGRIQLVDNDWYGVMAVSIVEAQVKKVAAWVEADYKLYITRSADADIVDVTFASDDPSTGSIARVLAALAYARTACIYHTLAATQYADAAWFGACFPSDAGSITWCFKTLSGVTVDSLTTTQRANVTAKYCNFYEAVAGRNIIRWGMLSGNEFIDITRGIDWLRSRLEEDIYERLASLPKIPFTDAGIATIESVVRKVLELGITQGFLATIDSITVLPIASVVPADKAARLLKDVKFTATLAGAIHTVQVSGVVTV